MLKPLGDRVLVGQIKAETKTDSGLLIVNNNPVKIQEGVVISVGPGLIDDTGEIVPISVKFGDVVAFGKYAGQAIQLEGVEFKIMHEHEILGVISR